MTKLISHVRIHPERTFADIQNALLQLTPGQLDGVTISALVSIARSWPGDNPADFQNRIDGLLIETEGHPNKAAQQLMEILGATSLLGISETHQVGYLGLRIDEENYPAWKNLSLIVP